MTALERPYPPWAGDRYDSPGFKIFEIGLCFAFDVRRKRLAASGVKRLFVERLRSPTIPPTDRLDRDHTYVRFPVAKRLLNTTMRVLAAHAVEGSYGVKTSEPVAVSEIATYEVRCFGVSDLAEDDSDCGSRRPPHDAASTQRGYEDVRMRCREQH